MRGQLREVGPGPTRWPAPETVKVTRAVASGTVKIWAPNKRGMNHRPAFPGERAVLCPGKFTSVELRKNRSPSLACSETSGSKPDLRWNCGKTDLVVRLLLECQAKA